VTSEYGQLVEALLPELALVLGALIVLGADLLQKNARPNSERLSFSVTIALLAIAGAMYGSLRAGVGGDVFAGVLVTDSLALATRLGVLLLGALTLAFLPGVVRLRHPAEYVAVVLFATAGFTLMAVAQQLLLAFLALELASLSLYVLTGFDKTRPESAEAGLKYFLFGGISAAFLLFGFSLIYGLTGSIEFPAIAQQLRTLPSSTLLIVAFTMILVAFGFKSAAAPFHLWAPDVYQGAPVSSAALIASGSKLAGFVLFVRLFWGGLGPGGGVTIGNETAHGWVAVVVVISALSLLLGNIAALAQTNVRRLLAYSAIAHAGALLLGVIAAGRFGPAPLFYYASTYGLATVGAFAVIGVVERAGRCQQLSDLAGLHRRSPLLALCLLVFILSLAGIPPLAGFFGKFVVFAAALKLGGLDTAAGWLTLLAIAMSAIGLYYYLLILKQALVAAPAQSADTRIVVPLPAALALLVTTFLLIALGVFPPMVLRILP
jgi:NADH-quinone oxidoreductase subunit N